MKEKLIAIKNVIVKKNKSRYNMLFSVVALIEVLMILFVSTYAWVETISSIQITANGNIDTYTYTDADIATGADYSGKAIDLTKYFKASGNVHLASASSANGTDFFFPKVANAGTSANAFRKGTINDKNTNYISFSFRVNAVETDAKFYFDKAPTFAIDGTTIANNRIRTAISVSDSTSSTGTTAVFSNNEVASENVVGNVDGTTVTATNIKAFSDYDNNGDAESNYLFEVKARKSKIVTLTLWLQDPQKELSEYAGKSVTCNDFKIVTGVKTTTIKFVDRTSANNAADEAESTWQWVANANAKMWVYSSDKKTAFEMTRVTDSTGANLDPPTWTLTKASDLLGDTTKDLYFYRTADTITSDPQNNYWNFWKTTLSSAGSVGIPTYSAYGNTKSDGKEGYGTWGDVSEIKVLGDNAESVLKTPGSSDTPQKLTIKNSASIPVLMNYNNGFWRAYIPKDANSKNLTLSIVKDSTTYIINANNRDTTQDASTYYVTSASTGYWVEPATVKAVIPSAYSSMGTVSVSGGPSGETTVKVTKGTTVTLKATPADNYVFGGWYSDSACTKKVNGNSQISVDASEVKTYTYYAKFQLNVTVIAKTDGVAEDSSGGTVQINDGTAGATASLGVDKGGSVTLTANPNTEDYEFIGWYNVSDNTLIDGSNTTLNITNLQNPINYYAVFNSKTFVLKAYAATNGEKGNATGGTVRFDSETTSSAYTTVTVKYKDTATFVAVVNETDGYEFKGWYSDEACTNCVTTELTYTADKNTEYKTMYAKFVLKKYDATAVAVTNGIENKSTGGTVKVTADGVTTAAGATVTTKVTHGTDAKFTATVSSGYNFVGWYDQASGGTLKSSSAEYTVSGVSADIKLYARFKEIYTITLTARTDGSVSSTGGTVKAGSATAGATSTVKVNYGDSVTIKATAKTGYDFVRWIKPSASTAYSSTAEYTITNVVTNISLYADFAIKKFTIQAYAVTGGTSGDTTGGTVSFDTEANSGAHVTVTVNYGGSATFKAFVKSSDGYEFKGWHEKADCSDTAVSTLNEYTVSSINADKTLYAEFALKKYTVTAVAVTTQGTDAGTVAQMNGTTVVQSGSTINITDVTHGSTVTLKAQPVDGANFEGWYDAQTGGNRLDDPSSETLTITVKNNQTVYARFKVTEKVTTIYFAERQNFSDYYAYVYDVSSGNKIAGDWPGTKLSVDSVTGYYKYTFTSTYTGTFKVIVDNGNSGEGNQYPTSEGLEGTYGKTYLFKGNTMTEYDPVTITLNAVSVNASGVTQSNGFTGGSIKVDDNTYTSAKTLPYNKGDSFTATATATGNYEFKGWYDNAACTGTAITGTLSITLNSNKTYYAKFVQKSTRTIYFTNNNNWSSVYCYAWNGSVKNASWPGISMTYVKTNGFNEKIYSIEIDIKYTSVIFNDNSSQTVDITLSDDVNAYYLTGEKDGSKYKVGTYTYS